MDSIITYLLTYNQYLVKIICELVLFISKHIPISQSALCVYNIILTPDLIHTTIGVR